MAINLEDKTKLRLEFLKTAGEEFELMMNKLDNAKTGLEFENMVVESAQVLNKLLITKSLGQVPKDARYKKNFKHHLAK